MNPEEMPIPKPITLETIIDGSINGREAIEWLQQQGKYVFHGTTQPISEFEPRQATNAGKPDGEPAIFATNVPDIAIFRSLVHREYDAKAHRNHSSSFDQIPNSDQWEFHTLPGEKDRIQQENRTGYVAVLPADSFAYNRDGEVVSHQPIKAITIVKTASKDLPEIIEDIS